MVQWDETIKKTQDKTTQVTVNIILKGTFMGIIHLQATFELIIVWGTYTLKKKKCAKLETNVQMCQSAFEHPPKFKCLSWDIWNWSYVLLISIWFLIFVFLIVFFVKLNLGLLSKSIFRFLY